MGQIVSGHPGGISMWDDFFLLDLVTKSSRRGRHLPLKAETVESVVDNWIYHLSGITPERQKQGGFTERRIADLKLAVDIINRLPVYTEESTGGPIVRHLVERDFSA